MNPTSNRSGITTHSRISAAIPTGIATKNMTLRMRLARLTNRLMPLILQRGSHGEGDRCDLTTNRTATNATMRTTGRMTAEATMGAETLSSIVQKGPT